MTPDRLYPLFASLRERLERGGGLHPFRRLDGHLLVALDGTEYFCSRKISCSNGSRRKRGDGAVEYHHNMAFAEAESARPHFGQQLVAGGVQAGA